MASTNSAVATGAGNDEVEMRRRKVSSHEKANGSTVYSLDAEDTKKLQKKVQIVGCAFLILPLTPNLQRPGKPILLILDEWEFIIAPLIFTAFALFTRLWRIGLSPIVTWDEAQ